MSKYMNLVVNQPDLEYVHFQGDGVTGTLSLGKDDLTITKNGTGDYTLTLKKGASLGFKLNVNVKGRHDTLIINTGLHDTGTTFNAVRFRLERSDTNALIDVPFSGRISKKVGKIDF